MADPATLLTEVLRAHADRRPDAVAYELVDPTGRVTTLSHAQLAGRASELARRLTAQEDGPALVLYPAGLDYVVAVLACFLAGRPVVPAYPPGQSSVADRTRLAGIVADAHPAVAVAPPGSADVPTTSVLAVPGPEADGAAWHEPAVAAGDVAVVQYTSGSTGRPRGVLVRHGSIAANTAAIAERFGLGPESRGLTWLPPFHDMGLVGGLLTPLAAGIPVRIMAPADFLKAPLSWLRQITESGATVSGGPNFAYDLCRRRARHDDALRGLDLSRWRVAFNGGEPVTRRVLGEFAARFAPVGLDPGALLPCYGLAEATLMVSAGPWAGPSEVAEGPVSCGTPVPGQRVRVVDPETGTPLPDGAEGEFWVAGPHVTAGYWSGPTTGLFGELDGEPFVRTGDLGLVRDGELVVTGRAKDVIVVRGVNHHAVDVEAAALDAAGAAARTAAAFQVDADPEPVPVLVLEVRGHPDESLAAEVRAAVLAGTRLPLGLVVLVPPRSLPRTSSGKIRRAHCRDALLAGSLDGAVADDGALLAALADGWARDAAVSELTATVCGVVAGVRDAPQCLPTDSLAALGVDSVTAAEAAAVLEDALRLTVPLDVVLAAPTPHRVAEELVAGWVADGWTARSLHDRVATVADGEEAAAWT